MGYIKSNFDRIIDQHGHLILVKHTDKKKSCPNKDHDSMCPHCFGLNYRYIVYKTKVRRSESQSFRSGALDNNDAISFKSNAYKYYFSSNYPINEKDFIIEYSENDIELYYVGNVDKHRGDNGEIAFKTVLAQEVSIDKKVIKEDLIALAKGR